MRVGGIGRDLAVIHSDFQAAMSEPLLAAGAGSKRRISDPNASLLCPEHAAELRGGAPRLACRDPHDRARERNMVVAQQHVHGEGRDPIRFHNHVVQIIQPGVAQAQDEREGSAWVAFEIDPAKTCKPGEQLGG